MFASNNKISVRQVYRLFVFDFIGVSTLVLPSRLARLTGSDGLWAILIGGVIASVYLWYLGKIMRGMKTDIVTYARQKLPTALKYVIMIFLGLQALWIAGFGAYIFADVMKRGLIPEESYTLILILILLVAGYAVHGGIESRARIYEVLFYILALALLLMFIIAACDVSWEYVGAFFESSPQAMVTGGIYVFFCFIPLFAVLFFPAYVERGKEKKMLGAVLAALWTAVLVLGVLYLILLGSFGSKALEGMRYPAVTLMSNIHLRSSYLKRFDAFMLGIWFFTLFALINLFLYYGAHLLQQAFTAKANEKKQVGNAVGMVLTFVAAELFYYQDLSEFFFAYICYVGMPMLILLPGIILFIGKAKKD